MEMIPVNSSAISAIGYNSADLHLKIKFVQGHTYYFCRVPQSVFARLYRAKSKGVYYNDHIKDRYKC
jgi:KTSC domain